jgi:hypothetical protein
MSESLYLSQSESSTSTSTKSQSEELALRNTNNRMKHHVTKIIVIQTYVYVN